MQQRAAPRLTVITGATSGIGSAIALMLVANGHDLLVVSRGGEALEAFEREVDAVRGPGAMVTVVADLALDDAPAEVARAVRDDGRPIRLLVHSAGVVELGPLDDEAAVGRFDRQLTLNARAPLALTVALLPHLAATHAHVVFVNSTAGLRANADWGAYAASKFALRAIADSLRDELRPRGIRVTSLFPGRTDSPMQREVHAFEGRPYDTAGLMAPEDVAAVLHGVIGLPAAAEASDVTIRPTGFS